MAVTKTLTVWCDGVDVDGCESWEYAQEGTRTIREARSDVAERMGWARVRTDTGTYVDLCPACWRRDQVPVGSRPDMSITMTLHPAERYL